MRHLVQVSVIAVFLLACGGNNVDAPKSSINPLARFMSAETFSFGATIDAATLVQEQKFSLYDSFEYVRGETYAISTPQELEAFNQTVARCSPRKEPRKRIAGEQYEVGVAVRGAFGPAPAHAVKHCGRA